MTKTVPVNRANWSPASKRSGAFHYHPDTYRDIDYKCSRCGRAAVFTAKEQQEAFEVRKAYIWQRRHLCAECAAIRLKLEQAVQAFRVRWKTDQQRFKADMEALNHWRRALLELPLYGGRSDPAHVVMIERLLAGAAEAGGAGSKP